MVRYRHYRLYVDGKMLPFGGATLATVDNGDGTITYGFAICSPLDNYRKSVGRELALARAQANGRVLKFNSRTYDTIEAGLSAKVLRNLSERGIKDLTIRGVVQPSMFSYRVVYARHMKYHTPLIACSASYGVNVG